jgi:hypothetical protein
VQRSCRLRRSGAPWLRQVTRPALSSRTDQDCAPSSHLQNLLIFRIYPWPGCGDLTCQVCSELAQPGCGCQISKNCRALARPSCCFQNFQICPSGTRPGCRCLIFQICSAVAQPGCGCQICQISTSLARPPGWGLQEIARGRARRCLRVSLSATLGSTIYHCLCVPDSISPFASAQKH